ncbi:MAG TPA: AraC family transcriptional regulator [Candidatus Paceibacterota bacterium]|nr:AraC family transcriptional regulator [Candidatus Paceibacterota bacterium]
MKARIERKSSPPEFFSQHVAEARRFYLNLAPPKSATLAVVCGGREHCTPDYAIHRSTFPYYSIEFVAQGRGVVRLQKDEHPLHAGKVFCYGPGIRQDIATDPSEPLVKYFVDFVGTNALDLLHAGGLQPGQALQVVAPGDLQVVFDELIHNGLRATRFSPEICSKLLECLSLKTAELTAPSEGVESPAFITYQKCRQHIQQNFERLRTLDQVSRECHLNNAYLCRLFRRFDHQTPYQFLMRLKMNRAAERLHEAGALVKQVAEQSGFSDQFHFSRAFKSVFGVSPDSFRKLR